MDHPWIRINSACPVVPVPQALLKPQRSLKVLGDLNLCRGVQSSPNSSSNLQHQQHQQHFHATPLRGSHTAVPLLDRGHQQGQRHHHQWPSAAFIDKYSGSTNNGNDSERGDGWSEAPSSCDDSALVSHLHPDFEVGSVGAFTADHHTGSSSSYSQIQGRMGKGDRETDAPCGSGTGPRATPSARPAFRPVILMHASPHAAERSSRSFAEPLGRLAVNHHLRAGALSERQEEQQHYHHHGVGLIQVSCIRSNSSGSSSSGNSSDGKLSPQAVCPPHTKRTEVGSLTATRACSLMRTGSSLLKAAIAKGGPAAGQSYSHATPHLSLSRLQLTQYPHQQNLASPCLLYRPLLTERCECQFTMESITQGGQYEPA